MKVARQQSAQLVDDPELAFIWQHGALEKEICTVTPCPSGINFINEMDREEVWKLAIVSNPENIDTKNYLTNTQTYTFVQLLRDVDGGTGSGGLSGSELGGGGSSGKYYLITVKGSGFPPGMSDDDKKDPKNARENVILQAVYAHLY